MALLEGHLVYIDLYSKYVLEIFPPDTTMPRALIFSLMHQLVVLYKCIDTISETVYPRVKIF
jgi:hypothetical protein